MSVQGSDVTAVFWGTFATARGLAIFAAIVASPNLIMWGSFAISGVGAIGLAVWGESYPEALYLGAGLLGVGMASIFATGFLWVERRMVVTSRIGASFTLSSSAGAKIIPLVVGQILEAQPMAVLYLILATWAGCLAIFASVTVVAARGEEKARSRNNQELATSETYQNHDIIN